jgi:hypothetical protein
MRVKPARPTFDDASEACAKWQKIARARDLSFWKDADQFTFIQLAPRFTKGIQDFFRRSIGGNRNGPHDFGERVEESIVVIALIHEKPNRPICCGQEQETVNE